MRRAVEYRNKFGNEKLRSDAEQLGEYTGEMHEK
jgi:hypothetical protein